MAQPQGSLSSKILLGSTLLDPHPVNQTKIKGKCQLERKVVPHDSKSDLLLDGPRKQTIFEPL